LLLKVRSEEAFAEVAIVDESTLPVEVEGMVEAEDIDLLLLLAAEAAVVDVVCCT
jgi:hypothetical protein